MEPQIEVTYSEELERRDAVAIAEVCVFSAAYFWYRWFLSPQVDRAGMQLPVALAAVAGFAYFVFVSPSLIHGDSFRVRGLGSWRTLFVRTDNLGTAVRAFGIFTLAVGVPCLAAARLRDPSLFDGLNWRVIFLKQGLYFGWACVQDACFFGWIMLRLKQLVPQRAQLALVTAALFAAFHVPNPSMMGLTFAAALAWSWIYFATPNLLALAVSHSVLGIIAQHFLAINIRTGPFYWEPGKYPIMRVVPALAEWLDLLRR